MKQQIPGLAIRRATMADIDTARDLTMRTFGETFGHLYPPDDLATFYRQSYSRAAFEQVLSDDSQALWLLSDGGAAVGHVLAGPVACRTPRLRPAMARSSGSIS